ncbi:MAG: hypothetical protein HC898_11555 [Phycisphaerales bacterium]|nr:hypothetical protein [Phycisphaerales bacterium]
MLLKPNLSEFAQAIDQPWLTLDLLPDQLRHWGQHIPMLMVSLGQQGLMLSHQGSLWNGQVDMDQHQVIDTVGCGDAMLAGCLMQLSRSPHDIPLLITTALSVATANATVVGAGNFDPQFAQSLAPACQVKILPFG